MYGSLEELCQPHSVPGVLQVPGASNPAGQVPDWVATTIWVSARSLMSWLAANVSASAAICSWVAPGGGTLLSWNTPSNTDWLKMGKPEPSPYCERMVDQLSFCPPGCRTPRPV